jgi:hypothetical protein
VARALVRVIEALGVIEPFGMRAPPNRPPRLYGGMEFVGHIGGGDTYAVAVQGDPSSGSGQAYAYIGEGPVLTILDTSNPASPILVGKTNLLPDIVRGVAVAGGYTYVADGPGGLLTLRYTGGFSISGHVRDSSGNPISGVTVSASAGSSATTDASGDYIITGVTTGTYTLTPSKSRYTFMPVSRMASVPPDATGQNFHPARPGLDYAIARHRHPAGPPDLH